MMQKEEKTEEIDQAGQPQTQLIGLPV